MRMSHRSLVAFGERLSPERSKRQGWYFTQGVNGLFARTYRFVFLAAVQHAPRLAVEHRALPSAHCCGTTGEQVTQVVRTERDLGW